MRMESRPGEVPGMTGEMRRAVRDIEMRSRMSSEVRHAARMTTSEMRRTEMRAGAAEMRSTTEMWCAAAKVWRSAAHMRCAPAEMRRSAATHMRRSTAAGMSAAAWLTGQRGSASRRQHQADNACTCSELQRRRNFPRTAVLSRTLVVDIAHRSCPLWRAQQTPHRPRTFRPLRNCDDAMHTLARRALT
jgi:hypothetical protein